MLEMETLLVIIRLISGFLLLSIASYTDLKTRVVSNRLWFSMVIIGIGILIIQYLVIGFELIHLVGIPLMFVIAYLLFRVGIVFGGADAKALMALSILVPFWPKLGNAFPLHTSMLPFPWVIFSNSILLFLFIPLILLIVNAFRKNIEFPYCLVGYKMNINRAKESFVWPLEKIDENGKRRFIWNPMSDEIIDKEIEKLEKIGKKNIWVTPKVPFMVPLLIGFILSFILGDILFSIVKSLMTF
jgi:preflagellin peptidase FlaK